MSNASCCSGKHSSGMIKLRGFLSVWRYIFKQSFSTPLCILNFHLKVVHSQCASIYFCVTYVEVLGGALVKAAQRPFGAWIDTTSLENCEDVGDIEEKGMTISSFLCNYVPSLDLERQNCIWPPWRSTLSASTM